MLSRTHLVILASSLSGLFLTFSASATVAGPINAQGVMANGSHEGIIAANGEQQFFTDVERRILQGILDEMSPSETGEVQRDHQGRGQQSRGGPPGRSGGLPPGIAMNLERGKALPPGIARQYPPSSVQNRLPERTDHEIVIVNDDAYLIGRATGVIVDILLGNR
ncbi:hypothetical protein [Fodinicurvata sp. EGI_FJ10296]|uniref:hypothetical protein n=1 Tax=Fodinicurvata sp. EGI_FJ10296 TaxID=3231908 RepID=UPI003456E1F9